MRVTPKLPLAAPRWLARWLTPTHLAQWTLPLGAASFWCLSLVLFRSHLNASVERAELPPSPLGRWLSVHSDAVAIALILAFGVAVVRVFGRSPRWWKTPSYSVLLGPIAGIAGGILWGLLTAQGIGPGGIAGFIFALLLLISYVPVALGTEQAGDDPDGARKLAQRSAVWLVLIGALVVWLCARSWLVLPGVAALAAGLALFWGPLLGGLVRLRWLRRLQRAPRPGWKLAPLRPGEESPPPALADSVGSGLLLATSSEQAVYRGAEYEVAVARVPLGEEELRAAGRHLCRGLRGAIALLAIAALAIAARASSGPSVGYDLRLNIGPDIELNGPAEIALGDLDGDSDLDLVTANGAFQSRRSDLTVFYNDGSGLFSYRHRLQVMKNSGWKYVAVADIDADSDIDILAEEGDATCVFRNDGVGRFSAFEEFPCHAGRRERQKLPLPESAGAPAGESATRDFDGDSDLDIATVRNYEDSTWRVQLLLAGQDGSLAPGWSLEAGAVMYPNLRIAAGDLDGDSDLDLVSTNSAGGGILILINDGAAGFTPR
jgi:hypothetical protein